MRLSFLSAFTVILTTAPLSLSPRDAFA